MVKASLVQQFLVSALLNDFPIIDHQHVIGVADGA
jgi:hypothetical protein